ncbi:MAG: tetratricopeptide repeat protein, partial [Gemmatimonadales bacterium]
MKLMTITAGLVLMAAPPLIAQTEPDSGIQARVANALAPHGRYESPICHLTGGDFRTNSAGLSLKTSAEGITDINSGQRSVIDSKKYHDIVTKAVSQATDAVTNNPKSAAGWYFLGRADLQLGDLRGADSAFTEVETLDPDCAEETKSYRQKAWLVLVQPSAEYMHKGQTDSALAVLRASMIISRIYPQGYYNLGGTFVDKKMYDSAVYYFKQAQQKSGSDPQFASTLKNSTYNLAYLYQQMGDMQNAITEYRQYLTYDPNNTDVKRALASALRLTGKTDEASALEQQLMASGAMSSGDLMSAGVRSFNAKDYAAAADAFQKVLDNEPYNRDAMFNLANSYFAMDSGQKLIETSTRLLAIEPLSEANVKLLANGYRLVKNQDKQIEITTNLLGMTTKIAVDSFRPTKTGAKLWGGATGNAAVNSAGKT